MKWKYISFIILFSTLVFSQDEGLYAPAPPADAAFVRVVHSSVEADVVSVIIGEASYGELGFSEVTPYRVVLRGDQQIQVGDSSEDFMVEVGKFYTVAVLPGGVEVLEDKANENRAKALLSLYNLGDMELVDLKTADGSTDVIMGVSPGMQSSIEVNGISVALGVFSSSESIMAFDETKLERGAAYSAFLLGSADNPSVVWVQSETTTE